MKRKRETDDESQPASKKSGQKYKTAYTEKWRCLGPSRKGPTHVYCSTCDKDFSCAHSGQYDCKKHCESSSHLERQALLKKNTTLTTFLARPNPETTLKRNVTKSELMMCELIAELNLSLSSADTFTKAFKEMFPDSKIAAGE